MEQLFFIKHDNHWIEHVSFGPCGQSIATCAAHTLTVFKSSPEKQNLFSKYAYFCENIDDILWKSTFHPKEAFICSISNTGMLHVHDIHHKSKIYSIILFNSKACFGIAFHPNGHMLAVSGLNKNIKLCRFSDGSLIQLLSGHLNCIEDVQFSPNGLHLASCSKDNTVKLWYQNNNCWMEAHSVKHSKWVFSCSFSPNGKLLATASADRKIGLWLVNNGQCLRFLYGHTNIVWLTCFLDDSTLVSCSSDGTFRTWKVSSRNPVAINTITRDSEVDDKKIQIYSCSYNKYNKMLALSANCDKVYIFKVL